MPTFFIILFLVYLLGNTYIFLRGKQALVAQSTGVKVLLSILFWSGTLSFFVSFLFRDMQVPASLAFTIQQVGTGWLVLSLYMVILLGLFDLLKLINRPFKYGFYLSSGITLSLLSYGFYTYQHPDTKVINIVINKPAEVEQRPLKIVAVSDVHLGYGTDKGLLKKYVTLINAQHPDLILIGGDLIDNSITPVRYEKMEEELALLKAPLGIYMVPGNHEYISGMEECADFIRSTPICLLRDSIVTLPNQLQLIGRDDRHNPNRLSLAELIKNIDPNKPVILIDHQPYELDKTAEAGIDLQFSGHTHHGQIWPISLITDYIFELSYGLMQKGNSQIYVSSGLSLWGPPFRIGTNSELVVFNISFK